MMTRQATTTIPTHHHATEAVVLAIVILATLATVTVPLAAAETRQAPHAELARPLSKKPRKMHSAK